MSSTSSPLDGTVALTHWSVLRADGADAAAFLHGQLTQDVLNLRPEQARLAAYCSAKGRMLASFVVWRPATDTVLLACHHSVAAATLKRLSMFVLRAKCVLRDVSDELALQGLVGIPADVALGDAAVWDCSGSDANRVIRLPDADGQRRAMRVIVRQSADDVEPTTITLDTWRWLDVLSGVASIEAATVDQFVPQMLNYEQIGGVDFRKGCYPGQEVVARSQYRGTVKRRTLLFEALSMASAGDEVFAAGDASQPAGMVVNAASDGGIGCAALVEVKLAALDAGPLHLRGIDGPVLVPRELPYPLALG